MGQKNATPTREQANVLEKHGLKAWEWIVMRDLQHSMIVKSRSSGEIKHIRKD